VGEAGPGLARDLARAGFTVRRIVDFVPEPDSEIYRALESLSDRGAISF